MSWSQRPLGEVIRLKRGHDLPASQRVIGEIPVISSSGITGYHNAAKAEGPGVVTGRYGTLGEVHYIEGPYWPLNTALYVEDFKGNYPRFVGYLLTTLELGAKNEAGAVPGVNRNTLHQMSVRVPDVDTQVSIATVLLQYDELIETNRRRIALLDESARLLYREWFVCFRFPGYELALVKDGLPEGWAKVPLGELAFIIMGQSPESKYYNRVGEGLPFHQGVSGFGDHFVSLKTYTTQTTRIAEAGDILCSVRAPVGRLNLTSDKIAIGRGLSAMRSRNNQQSLLLYQLKALFVEEDMIGGGAIFASVTKKELFAQQLLQPDIETATEFDRQAGEIIAQLETLEKQNRLLAQARDELLPKLMSGEIQV